AAAEEEVRGVVAQARAALEQNERRLRELRDQVRRLELDRESVQREMVDATRRAETLEGELQQVTDNVASIAGELSLAEEALERARVQVAQSTAALDGARVAAREARDRESAARSELARAAESLHQLEGKANALEALERERVGLAPAAAKLLRDRQQFGEGAVLGPLSDFIETTPDTALLVERFLGANLHAVLVRDREATEAVRRWHARANPGPLLLLPLDAEPPDHATEGDSDATTLLARVNAAPAARGWIRNLLGRVRAEEAGAAFVDARGAVWLPGAVSGPGPLRRRAELGELRDAVAAAEAARLLATDGAEQARAALQAAERAATTAAEEAAGAQRELRRAEELRAELERRRQRAQRELAEAQALHDRLLQRRGELAERLEALGTQADTADQQLTATEEEGGSLRERLGTAEQMLEEAREFRTTCQVQQAQAQARLQVARDRERRLAEELTTAEQRMHALHSELTTLADSDQRLATQMDEWRGDLDAREGTLRDAEARLAAAESALHEADEALAAAERQLDEARRDAAQRSEEQHQAELRYSELSGRRRSIHERLETEWRRPLDELMTTATMLDVDEAQLRDEAEELKAQLDALGPVNPLAIEEHDEEVKRLDFLTAQRNDLAQAKQSLQHAIREIDTTARELFLATFAQVRENFRQIFMTLFGGGECDLRLENPEQPLDCDIEVHASPRGKRTQRIHLLSSGERALVALSLLFGIFLTKPSPFCLLDEVDAPLDDQNIGRYVRMLNQFKSRTQFIVITHNPRTTTEAADAVYGVTMQEPGVSSLVSVRMRGRHVDDGAAADAGEGDEEPESAEAAAAPA
ncbi:MAG TPA: AAA family ATPase, partial [Gemmatimonadaceae bacterium]